jgi:hemerythrin-like domain-containing protein
MAFERARTNKQAVSSKSQDAISLLKEDHKKVKALLKELDETTSADIAERERLFDEIRSEITVHSKIEEEIFYPAFREAVEKEADEKLFFEATEEHHVVDLVLPELAKARTGTPIFGAKAKVLRDLIEHHAKEEEDEMFPRAKKLLSKEELLDLGARLESRKQALLSRSGSGRRLATAP